MRRDERLGAPGLAALELVPVEPDAGPPPSGGRVLVEQDPPQCLRWLRSFDVSRPEQLGTEFTVRRRIHAALDAALPALLAVGEDPGAGHAHRSRLALDLTAAHRDRGVLRVPARLHGAWLPRTVPTELDLEAWSATQCELRLQSRRRHGRVRPSPRYFDAAHDVLDVLRAAVERRIDEAFKP